MIYAKPKERRSCLLLMQTCDLFPAIVFFRPSSFPFQNCVDLDDFRDFDNNGVDDDGVIIFTRKGSIL